jgi:hypothetical protein
MEFESALSNGRFAIWDSIVSVGGVDHGILWTRYTLWYGTAEGPSLLVSTSATQRLVLATAFW